MTVGDLIDYLQQFDKDTLVFATEDDAADAIEPSESGTDYISIEFAIRESDFADRVRANHEEPS